VKVKKEGCCMSGRRPDGQTEWQRSPNEVFMHGREYTAPCRTHSLPGNLQARTAAGGNTAGVPMDDQCWSAHVQMRERCGELPQGKVVE
jgi:hypothetical protein